MKKVALGILAVLFSTMVAHGQGPVRMGWDAVFPAPTGYWVYRGVASGVYPLPPINMPQTATAYTDTSVSAGQTYFYTVTAFNAAGESMRSNEIMANVPASLSVAFTQPAAATVIKGNIPVLVTATGATRIEFYINNALRASAIGNTLSWTWRQNQRGTFTLRAVAFGPLGETAIISKTQVVINP